VLYRQLNAESADRSNSETDTDLDDGVVLRASDPSPEQAGIIIRT